MTSQANGIRGMWAWLASIFGHAGAQEGHKGPTAESWDENVPAYPPFQHGLPSAIIDGVLASQQRLVGQIQDQLGFDHSSWNSLVLPLLRRYVEIVHLLPASETHHHRGAGGLYRHGLETAFWAARSAESRIFTRALTPRARRDENRRWVLAAFVAGLLHDIGKPISDLSVTNKQGDLEWNPHEPLAHWLERHKLSHYYLHWNPKRQHKRHESYSLLYLTYVIEGRPREYFLAHRELMEALLSVLSGMGHDTEFGRLILWADRESTQRDLKQQRISPDEYSYGVPVEKYIIEVLRVLIGRDRDCRPNIAPWNVIRASQGVYLNWRVLIPRVIEALRQDGVSGVPSHPDTLGRMMIERGHALGQPAPDSASKDAYYLYTRLRIGQPGKADDNGEVHLEPLQDRYLLIEDPDLLLSAIAQPDPVIAEPFLNDTSGEAPTEQIQPDGDHPMDEVVDDVGADGEEATPATTSSHADPIPDPAAAAIPESVPQLLMDPADDDEIPPWVLAAGFDGTEGEVAETAVGPGGRGDSTDMHQGAGSQIEFADLLVEAGLANPASVEGNRPDESTLTAEAVEEAEQSPGQELKCGATATQSSESAGQSAGAAGPSMTASSQEQKEPEAQAIEAGVDSVEALLAEVSIFERDRKRKEEAARKRLRKLEKRAARNPGDYSDIHFEREQKRKREEDERKREEVRQQCRQRRDDRVTIAPEASPAPRTDKQERLESLLPDTAVVAPRKRSPAATADGATADRGAPPDRGGKAADGAGNHCPQQDHEPPLTRQWLSFQAELQRRCHLQAMDEEVAQLMECLVRDILTGARPLGEMVWVNRDQRLLVRYPDAIQIYAGGGLADRPTRSVTSLLERSGLIAPMKDHPPGQRPVQRDPDSGEMVVALSNTINAIVRKLLEAAEALLESGQSIPELPTLKAVTRIRPEDTFDTDEAASAESEAVNPMPTPSLRRTRKGSVSSIDSVLEEIRQQIVAGEGDLIMDMPHPVSDREWRVQESILARAASASGSLTASAIRMHMNMKQPAGLRLEGQHVVAARLTDASGDQADAT